MSTTNDININMQTIEEEANGISSASQYFSPRVPAVRDYESTITANSNEKSTIYSSQQALTLFGCTLDKDAANIKGLGLAFVQYDEMLANLMKD